jgi:hypothetical protein
MYPIQVKPSVTRKDRRLRVIDHENNHNLSWLYNKFAGGNKGNVERINNLDMWELGYNTEAAVNKSLPPGAPVNAVASKPLYSPNPAMANEGIKARASRFPATMRPVIKGHVVESPNTKGAMLTRHMSPEGYWVEDYLNKKGLTGKINMKDLAYVTNPLEQAERAKAIREYSSLMNNGPLKDDKAELNYRMKALFDTNPALRSKLLFKKTKEGVNGKDKRTNEGIDFYNVFHNGQGKLKIPKKDYENIKKRFLPIIDQARVNHNKWKPRGAVSYA